MPDIWREREEGEEREEDTKKGEKGGWEGEIQGERKIYLKEKIL